MCESSRGTGAKAQSETAENPRKILKILVVLARSPKPFQKKQTQIHNHQNGPEAGTQKSSKKWPIFRLWFFIIGPKRPKKVSFCPRPWPRSTAQGEAIDGALGFGYVWDMDQRRCAKTTKEMVRQINQVFVSSKKIQGSIGMRRIKTSEKDKFSRFSRLLAGQMKFSQGGSGSKPPKISVTKPWSSSARATLLFSGPPRAAAAAKAGAAHGREVDRMAVWDIWVKKWTP